MEAKVLFDAEEPSADALRAASFAQRVYTKGVRSAEDLGKWRRSQAYYDVVAYINNTSMALQGQEQDGGGFVVSLQVKKLCKIFNWLDRLVFEHHPLGVGQGLMLCSGGDKMGSMDSTTSLHQKCHRAFRQWLKIVQEKIFSILERQLAPNCKYINELAQYLSRSFGTINTFDYGPCHELIFVFFLCGLFKSGILEAEDTVAAVLVLFQRYLDLVRRLVSFYRLTSLYSGNNVIDERNILPYIWGSAQLCLYAPFSPPQWELPAIMEAHRNSYMLLSSMEYLQKTKGNAVLGVHSYQLWCALSLSNWPDTYAGLMDTYIRHLLNDFFSARNLIFSEMMSFEPHSKEYLKRAYFGESSKQSSISMDNSTFEEEAEEELIQVKNATVNQPDKQIKEETKRIRLPPQDPPIPRHLGYDADIYLGFQDLREGSFEDELPLPNALNRSRNHSQALATNSKFSQPPHHSEPTGDTVDSHIADLKQLSALLGITKSDKTDSTASA